MLYRNQSQHASHIEDYLYVSKLFWWIVELVFLSLYVIFSSLSVRTFLTPASVRGVREISHRDTVSIDNKRQKETQYIIP